jgi:hypothetical protein
VARPFVPFAQVMSGRFVPNTSHEWSILDPYTAKSQYRCIAFLNYFLNSWYKMPVIGKYLQTLNVCFFLKYVEKLYNFV